MFGGLGQNKDGLYFPSCFLLNHWFLRAKFINMVATNSKIVSTGFMAKPNAIMMSTHTKIPISNIVVYFLNVGKDRLFVLKKQIFQGVLWLCNFFHHPNVC